MVLKNVMYAALHRNGASAFVKMDALAPEIIFFFLPSALLEHMGEETLRIELYTSR